VKRVGLAVAALLLGSTAMTVASASDLPVDRGTIQMVALEPMAMPTPTLDGVQPTIPIVPATESPSGSTPTPTPAPLATASDPTPGAVESAPGAAATSPPDPSGSPAQLP